MRGFKSQTFLLTILNGFVNFVNYRDKLVLFLAKMMTHSAEMCDNDKSKKTSIEKSINQCERPRHSGRCATKTSQRLMNATVLKAISGKCEEDINLCGSENGSHLY